MKQKQISEKNRVLWIPYECFADIAGDEQNNFWNGAHVIVSSGSLPGYVPKEPGTRKPGPI
jgi:hypothetical protein